MDDTTFDALEAVLLIITLITAFICGFLCGKLGEIKGYSKGWAQLSGFLFGILGLIYYAGLPIALEQTNISSNGLGDSIKTTQLPFPDEARRKSGRRK